jgi:hypothetical protein
MKGNPERIHPAPPASGNRANEVHCTVNIAIAKPGKTPDFSTLCVAKRCGPHTRITAVFAWLADFGRLLS